MLLYIINYILTQSHILYSTGHLRTMARQFFREGLAVSTRNTYDAAQQRFLKFCTAAKSHSIPATEATLMLFATHLASTNISHATIKVYLSAVRNLHVSAGYRDHFNLQLTPRLQQVLRGIEKHQSSTQLKRVRLPVTLQIMCGIKEVLSREPQSYNNIMLWAACCIAFFGFMRVGKFTIPSQDNYDKSSHLSLSDISVDSREQPRLIKITIKQSKTDPFCRGLDVYLGATDRAICPILGILPYLAARGDQAGPLFTTEDGRALTRQIFSTQLDSILAKLRLDTKSFNTHSFRIGAATTAAEAHIPDSYIKMLGRWQSDVYQQYIKTPPQELAKLSRQLATPPKQS